MVTVDGTENFEENDANNPIIHELFAINKKPCLLFVHCHPDDIVSMTNEADRLSFTSFTQGLVSDCVSFLVKDQLAVGRAVHSTSLENWFTTTSKKLSMAKSDNFLFDPTVLIVGILRHLGTTLKQENRLDIEGVEAIISIPINFIEEWGRSLQVRICGKDRDMVIRDLLGFN